MRIQPELVDDLLPLDGLDPITATCTEPLACALRAQDRVGLTPRDTLLVVGAGTSGLLHIGAARARGVERVLVAEPRADRRERALEWGAAAFAPGEPVDVAIVTSHHPQAVAAAAAALGAGRAALRLRPAGAGRADRGRRRRDLPARADRHRRPGRRALPTGGRRSRCCGRAR